jgi:hypothetical protein
MVKRTATKKSTTARRTPAKGASATKGRRSAVKAESHVDTTAHTVEPTVAAVVAAPAKRVRGGKKAAVAKRPAAKKAARGGKKAAAKGGKKATTHKRKAAAKGGKKAAAKGGRRATKH